MMIVDFLSVTTCSPLYIFITLVKNVNTKRVQQLEGISNKTNVQKMRTYVTSL